MVVALTIICAIGSLLILFWLFAEFSGARDSRSWPSTSGRIVSGESIANADTNRLPGHSYQVRYRYSVGEQEFEGHTLRFGYFNYYSRRAAERHAQHYPVGAEVTVYYMPAAPQVSVLEPGLHCDLLFPLAAFLVVSGPTIFVTSRWALSFIR